LRRLTLGGSLCAGVTGVAGLVVGSGEDGLTKLSTEELKDLFALRGEALGE
jgi:hypothetical protein